MSIVGNFFDSIDQTVGTFIMDGYTNVAEALDTPLRLMLVLFIAVYGYAMLFGRVEFPLRGAIRQSLIAIFVVTFATTNYAATAATFVSGVFIDGPNQLASAIVGGQAAGDNDGSLKDTIGEVWDKGVEAGSNTWERGGWGNLSAFVMGLAVWTITAIMLIPAIAYLVLAKIALAVLLVLTPFMVVMLLFSSTKGIFEGWLRQVINFALIPVIIFGILALILSIGEQAAEQITTDTLQAGSAKTLMPAIGAYAIVGFVSAILFSQVNNIAGGIAGGVSLSTLGRFAQAGRPVGRMAMRGARRVGRGASVVGRNI